MPQLLLLSLFLLALLALGFGLRLVGNRADKVLAERRALEPSFAGDIAEIHSAAEQGEAGAQNKLACLYANGEGVAQDYVEARKWYLKAAEQGVAGAQNKLGGLYINGQGVAQDYVEARKWYLKAAEPGDAEAQFTLGGLYYRGQGVPQDYVEARQWYLKAAEQGHAKAQFTLGVLYSNGDGVTQDYSMAYVWTNIAAAQVVPDARKFRDAATSKLDSASLAEAQKLSREYFKLYVEPFQ